MLCGPVFLNLLGSKSQKFSVTVQVKKNLIVNIMAVPFGNLYKSLVKTRYDTGPTKLGCDSQNFLSKVVRLFVTLRCF
jgi:hypothetical protein